MAPKHKAHRIVSRVDDREGGEEHEIATQILVPQDGGWGWLVVMSSFLNILILDGVAYTFGSQLHDIALDLKVSDSLVALVNSIAVALYFIASPLASALINRYGFRECAMTGSIICCFSLFISYFVEKFGSLCVFYGVICGFGYCLINMSSGLIVGFYFEKLRSVALAIATCGSSVGIMTCFPLNTYLVSISGWRATTLLHSGLFGIIFFLSMAFRPLLSVSIMKTEEDAIKTITYLPSLMSADMRTASHLRPDQDLISTATERLFSAVSNANFPTAAKVLEEDMVAAQSQAGPSNAAVSKLTLTSYNLPNHVNQQQLKQVQSILSKTSEDKLKIEIKVSGIRIKRHKRKCCDWKRWCHWEPHVRQSRPMYKDDAFYDGRLQNLQTYQKSMLDATSGAKTGLEYQFAVSRTATVIDLQERPGVFSTAVRRVLATMMDPFLLKRCSFLLMCGSGFLTYLGFLVPYVYLKDRNLNAGVDPKHCTFFISAIGLSNAFGRIGLGSLASKIDPLKLFAFSCITAGISTIMSDLSYNLYYQYCYCCVFGFCIASVACLRSLILVSLYGLDKLTNATGMMLIFLGLGNLVSTPIAGVLKNSFGYRVAFYVAGTFIAMSGFLLIPVKSCLKRENKRICRPIVSKTQS